MQTRHSSTQINTNKTQQALAESIVYSPKIVLLKKVIHTYLR